MLKKALHGLYSDYSFLLLSNIVNLISVPFILSSIGKEAYGIQGTIFQVLSHFTLLELGVGVFLIKIYQVHVKNEDHVGLNKTFSTAFFLYLFASIIVIILAFIFLIFLKEVIKTGNLAVETKYTFLIAVIWTALSIPLGIFNTILHAQQRLALVKSLLGIQALLNTMMIIVFLLLKFGLLSFGIAYLVSGSIISYLCFNSVKRGVINININRKLFEYSTVKSILKFTWEFGFAKIAALVKNSSDLIFISILYTVSDVTDFMLTGKLFMLLIMVAQRVPLVLLPGFGELYAYENYDKIYKYFKLLSYYSIRGGILIGLLILISNEYFVTIWVGKSNYGGQTLNFVFFLYFLKEIYFNSIGFILYSYGELKNLNKVSILEVILKVAFILILSRFLKLESILIGGILAGMFSTVLFYPLRICHSIGLNIIKYLKESIIQPIILSSPIIITYLIILLLKIKLNHINILVSIITLLILINVISFDFNFIKRKYKEILAKQLFS